MRTLRVLSTDDKESLKMCLKTVVEQELVFLLLSLFRWVPWLYTTQLHISVFFVVSSCFIFRNVAIAVKLTEFHYKDGFRFVDGKDLNADAASSV